jgi:hypothetical protein
MSKFIITATAPTSYQLSSLNAFGMGYVKHGNGSYSASLEFESIDNARAHLIQRAEMYNDQDPCGTLEKLTSMVNDVMSYDCLRLDAVTAHIEKVENALYPEGDNEFPIGRIKELHEFFGDDE